MTDTHTPFHTVFARLAGEVPDRPALTSGGLTLTRRELEQRTNRLARAYASLGVKHDSFVTIGLANGIDFVEAMIATWKLGATPQPVSHALPATEREAIIELAKPSLVVGYTGLDAPGRRCVSPGFAPDASLSDAALPVVVATAFKAPTSGGSTGRPKLIVSTQTATLEAVISLATLCGIQENGVALCTGPLYHNGPFSTTILALLLGNHVVVMPRFDALQSLELIAQHRVSWMYAVPTMMHRIWRLDPAVRTSFDLSSLKAMIHMGAPCPAWLKAVWIEWLGPERVLELYGGTEAQAATVINGVEWLAHRGSVGRAVVGEIQILDANGAPVPPGTTGEVWMRRGADAAPAYRYMGATAKARAEGWESLGDLGHMDADGYVYLSDRESDMIVVGGANVYPAEIEAVLDAHPQIMSSCVIGLPNDEYGNVVHAIIQTASPIDEAALASYLQERLVKYKRPRSVEFVGSPLRGDDGKVRRAALRAARLKR